MTQHTILYIPGLGDKSLAGRRHLMNLWHYRGIKIEIHAVDWQTNEAWQIKLNKLLARIDQLHAEGTAVSLIGESAGASAAIQSLRQQWDKLNAVILLCGKSQFPERVSPKLYKLNPTLEDAVTGSYAITQSLTDVERGKLLSLYPLFDPVVPVDEAKVLGAQNARMPIVGHILGIIFANTLWSWRIVKFVRIKAH